AERMAAELTGVAARAVKDADEAIEGADIIVAATSSSSPVFDGAKVAAGTH
ncbi:MAG: ornithine cyclodeaminase family protein, partial [Gemmatimonadetes bacterium]|nr:ornithine cyclodeaminase family protein [Gemmatimonadota bacterium]NIQ52486.1 ornithine cyclodeaminase family protein [Gemmatimonadota bacterium]NIU72620.1 ornithine cyclodeaminase family protein [Gammaproteobacteria bacterium]NIX43024.1 ornithine cyclodeaminase family protein [Gemmatimonadota bacterium]